MTRLRNVTAVLVAAVMIAATAPAAVACFMVAPQPVQVVLDQIDVVIHDNVAVKTYDCHFTNPNGGAIVGGTCYMELAPDAQIDNLTMIVGEDTVEAEILDVNRANEVFQEIVANGGSPALLEYYGNRLVRTQVPNVPAGGEAIVKLQYTQVLDPMNGVYRLSMLNTNPKMEMQVLREAAVNIHIHSSTGVQNLYSPTHDIVIDESVEEGIMVRWRQENYLPKSPFVIYWANNDQQIGMNLVAYKEHPDEDGHFMAMLSPTVGSGPNAVTDDDIISKDICFVVDTSGSMVRNNKMEQAKAALRYCVENLRDGDRFNIVDFSTAARAFDRDGLVPVTDESRERALRYVENMRARGGTAIQEALTTALNQFSGDDRLKMIFFATDGLPTIGERDADRLLAQINEANQHDVRMFCFGEGTEVNSYFLDMLADGNRGESDYILPEEDIAVKIAQYFDKVGSPMLADVRIDIEESDGVRVDELYPRTLPDLFRGDRLVLFGRYSGSGTVHVTVSGVVNGRERQIEYDLVLPAEEMTHEFVPRLWAGRKVGHLLNEIRKGGEDQELIDEVVRIATQYGIVTPYTAFLAVSDIANPSGPAPQPGLQGMRRAVRENLEAGFAADSAAQSNAAPGELDEATRMAHRMAQLDADGAGRDAYALAEAERRARGGEGSVLNVMRYIGGKTFYQSGGAWYDSTYDPEVHTDVRVVAANTDGWREALAGNPGIAKYLAIGEGVFRYRGITWRVTTTPLGDE